MSAARLVVRDGRQLPALEVSRADLAILAERCERRRVAATRSTYLALMEASTEPGPWTMKALAERAGVGTDIAKDAAGALERAGLLRVMEDGSWQLGTSAAVEELPLALPTETKAEPQLQDPVRERAEKFYAVHAKRVEHIRGGPVRRDETQIAAAVTILKRQPDAREILARIDFALGERFFADKVLRLTDLNHWWPKISAAYLASRAQQQRQPDGRVDAPARAGMEIAR